jgi:hypothetical protein
MLLHLSAVLLVEPTVKVGQQSIGDVRMDRCHAVHPLRCSRRTQQLLPFGTRNALANLTKLGQAAGEPGGNGPLLDVQQLGDFLIGKPIDEPKS